MIVYQCAGLSVAGGVSVLSCSVDVAVRLLNCVKFVAV